MFRQTWNSLDGSSKIQKGNEYIKAMFQNLYFPCSSYFVESSFSTDHYQFLRSLSKYMGQKVSCRDAHIFKNIVT